MAPQTFRSPDSQLSTPPEELGVPDELGLRFHPLASQAHSQFRTGDEESQIDSADCSRATLVLPAHDPVGEETQSKEQCSKPWWKGMTPEIKLVSNQLAEDETRKFFNRDTIPSTPCVFLCWGPPQDCRIIPVPVGQDDDWNFQQLQDA